MSNESKSFDIARVFVCWAQVLFGCMEGFILQFDMCGEKLRVKTFFQYRDPFGKKC